MAKPSAIVDVVTTNSVIAVHEGGSTPVSLNAESRRRHPSRWWRLRPASGRPDPNQPLAPPCRPPSPAIACHTGPCTARPSRR